jgi:hypothetical protein
MGCLLIALQQRAGTWKLVKQREELLPQQAKLFLDKSPRADAVARYLLLR